MTRVLFYRSNLILSLISRLINTSNYCYVSVEAFTVNVNTGSEQDGGTDANVFLEIFDESGTRSGEVQLTGSLNANPFELGQKDVFNLDLLRMGKTLNITFGLISNTLYTYTNFTYTNYTNFILISYATDSNNKNINN